MPLVSESLASIDVDGHILVVDDHSPDGTADVVRRMQASMPHLHLLEGPKAGLGAAYVRGMSHAITAMHADVVYEMDADFSHKPGDIPRLYRAIEAGADFVIGSRYVEGGSIPGDWGVMRKLNSFGGNVVTRYIAGIGGIRDCTSGFRAIRAPLLAKLGLDQLRVQGYGFQVALLYESVIRDARVVEIPIEFVDREEGESKLGLRDIAEFITNAFWIRFRSSQTFLKFLLVGASGVIVNLGTFTVLLGAGMNKYLASPIAIEVSILTNFALNNIWTFRSRKTMDSVQVKGLKYNIVSLVALAVSYGTFLAISYLSPRWPPQVAQLVGIVPATIVNYLLNSYWTFRHNGDEVE